MSRRRSIFSLLTLCGIISAGFFALPGSVHADFPIPPGKTLAANGEACSDTGLVPASESDVRQSGGVCNLTFTDGTLDVITFDPATQTQTTQLENPATLLTGATNIGPPTTVSWTAAANQAAQQAAATAAANPTNAAAQQAAQLAAQQATTAAQDQTQSAAASGNGCNFASGSGNVGTCILGILSDIIKTIALAFLFLAAVFVGVTGLIFNWTIYTTIFQFGNLVGNNAGMLAAWGVLRDIGNILLLFGFILMGVSTILDLPNSNFTAKRALPALIIFAILLNFSLFAAEAVIDTTNALGSTFFNQAGNGLCPTGANVIDCATKYGIAGRIFEVSGISSIFNVNAFNPANSSTGSGAPQGLPDGIAGAIAAIGLTLFLLVTAFVFMVAFILLIVRAVVLAFLMTVSPIGFAGMAIPPLHGLAKQWWDQLLKQAFFAPVMILLMLISIAFMGGVATALGTGGNTANGTQAQNLAAAFTTSGASNMSIVIVFLLLIGFMLASVQLARQMGAAGAGAATRMAGGAVFGTYTRGTNLLVNGFGRGTRAVIQASPIRNSAVGAALTNTLARPLENMNTDLRRLPGMSAAPVRALVGAPAEHATLGDMVHQYQGVGQKLQESRAQYDREVRRGEALRELKGAKKTDKLDPQTERFIAGQSAEQIAADHDLMHALEHAAERLSPDQFEGLMKSDKVAEGTKTRLAESRFADQLEIANRRDANGNAVDITDDERAEIRRMSNKELEMMAKYQGAGFANLMGRTNANGDTLTTNAQNENLENNNGLTTGQRQTVRDNTKRGKVEVASAIIANPNSTPAEVATAQGNINRYANGLAPKEKNKLNGSTILNNPNVMRNLTSDDLREFMRETKFTNPADRAAVGRAIRNPLLNNNAVEIGRYLASDPRAAAYWQ